MRKQTGIAVIAIAFLTLFVAACGSKGPASVKSLTDNDVLVRFDDKSLTFGDFKEYCATVGGSSFDRVPAGKERGNRLTAMLNDTLLGTEALARGIDNSDVYRTRMALFETQVLPPVYVEKEISNKVEVAESDFKKYIKPQPLRIRLQTYVSDNEAQVYDALRRAQAGEDFDAIVKASSEGITRARGGDVGYVAIGAEDLFLKPEQEHFRTLNKGEYSKVFKTRIGYMVVKVIDILTPEEQAKQTAESLKDRIKLEKEREAYDRAIVRLRKAYKARLDGRNLERIGTGKVARMSQAERERLPIAWIGKEPVPYASLLALGAPSFHSPADLARMAGTHLDEVVVSREARRLGLGTDPAATRPLKWLSRNALARLLIADIARGVAVEEADYRTYYDTHAAEFKIPELVRLSVVETGDARRAAEALALLNKGTPFADVVNRYADNAELKKKGGDVGFVPVERLIDEMKALAPKMKEGDTSPVITVAKPKQRYLVFRVTGRKAAAMAEFTSIRREVVEPRILAQKRETAIKTFMEEAGKKHKVEWVKANVDTVVGTGTENKGAKKEAGK